MGEKAEFGSIERWMEPKNPRLVAQKSADREECKTVLVCVCQWRRETSGFLWGFILSPATTSEEWVPSRQVATSEEAFYFLRNFAKTMSDSVANRT